MTTFAAALASARPSEIALRDPRMALGWSEVDDTINRAANALLEAELGPKRRVAIYAENSAETALAHVGAICGSASAVPVSYHLTVDDVADMLERSAARILFVGPETAPRGLRAARAVGDVVVVAWRCRPTPGLLDWEEWLTDAPDAEPPSDVPPRPPLLFTSGTTGRSKAVELPPTMFAGGASVAEHVANMAQHKFAGLGPHLVVGPLSHTGPLQGPRLLMAGVPVMVPGRFDAEATLAAIEQQQIASSVMVPTHFSRLLSLAPEIRARYDVSSLRHVVHTGAPCPPEVKRAMIDWWGPVLWESYGATEVGTTCSIDSHEWLAHPGSVGRTLPPFEAVIVDESGRPTELGVEGHLYFRDTTGRGVIYDGDGEASAAVHLEPGVFTLGEIGYLDADGYVFVTDRHSDLVVSGGVNVYPAEAEQVLAAHPDVADAACIGQPHADMGEMLHAVVVLRPDASTTEAELAAFCRARLAAFKCPRTYSFVDELPRTPMGKLDKRQLRRAVS